MSSSGWSSSVGIDSMNTITTNTSNSVVDDKDADRSLIESSLLPITVVVEKENKQAALQQQFVEVSTRTCDSSLSTTI